MNPSDAHREAARETMRRNATKHGLAAGTTKTTYYLCKSLLAHQPPPHLHGDREPDIATEWFDLLTFVRDVVDEIGPRPCRHYVLRARPDFSYLLTGGERTPTILKPGHIEWYLPPSAQRSKRLPPHPVPPGKPGRPELDDWDWPACPATF